MLKPFGFTGCNWDPCAECGIGDSPLFHVLMFAIIACFNMWKRGLSPIPHFSEDHLLDGENKDTLSTGGFELADDFPETFLVEDGVN